MTDGSFGLLQRGAKLLNDGAMYHLLCPETASRALAGPLEVGFSLVTENEVARIVDADEQHEVNGRRFGVELFERWREEISAACVPLDAISNASDAVSRFAGELKSGAVGALPMNEFSGRQVDVHRTRRTIRDSDPGVVKVGLQLRGRGVVVQQEREATLFPVTSLCTTPACPSHCISTVNSQRSS